MTRPTIYICRQRAACEQGRAVAHGGIVDDAALIDALRRADCRRAADNLIAALTGGTPSNILNPNVKCKE